MATSTLRQRHADRTRRAIVAAALELFEERGFVATTIDEIAGRADVAPRTFFRYFSSKEAVLYHDVGTALSQLVELLSSPAISGPPHTRLVAACVEVGEQFGRDRARMLLIRRLSQEEPSLVDYQRLVLMQQFEQTVVDTLARACGVDRTDIGLRSTTAALLSSLGVAFRVWIDAGAQGPMAPFINEAMVACRRAFSEGPSNS